MEEQRHTCPKCQGTGKLKEEIYDEGFGELEDPLDEEDYIPEDVQIEAEVDCYICNGKTYLTTEELEEYNRNIALEGRLTDWYLESEDGREED